jgi:hypothetical protein
MGVKRAMLAMICLLNVKVWRRGGNALFFGCEQGAIHSLGETFPFIE